MSFISILFLFWCIKSRHIYMAAGKNTTAKKILITCDVAIRDCPYHYRFQRIFRIHFIVECLTMRFIHRFIKVAMSELTWVNHRRREKNVRWERSDEVSERSGTECRMTGERRSGNMQHIAWPMQHGMIFTYLINGCPQISSGGNSEVPRERERKNRSKAKWWYY